MPNYNAMLTELEQEYKRLIEEREQVEQQIGAVAQAIEAVKLLAVEEPILPPPPISDEAGFTDKVRNLLRANPARSFAPTTVRDVLAEFDPKADQKILLIHTHNTLKRLFKQGEVEVENDSEGKLTYRWKLPEVTAGNVVSDVLTALAGGGIAIKDEHPFNRLKLKRKRSALYGE